MEKAKVCSLALILHEAGFSWAAADEVVGAIERISVAGVGPDDVAGSLLAWRRRAVRDRLRACRVRAQHLLDRSNDRKNESYDEKGVTHVDDPDAQEDDCQLLLYDDLMELGGGFHALAETAAKVIRSSPTP